MSVGAVALSCGPRETTGGIPVVDVTKTYPPKDIVLQDIADVEYIPLETREGFLVGEFMPVPYMDDDILLTYNDKGDIMTFDRRTGKGLATFNRKGRGPGEYTGVGGMVVCREPGEIFVITHDHGMNGDRKMLVYDMSGKFLRRFDLVGVGGLDFLDDYDADHIFFHTEDEIDDGTDAGVVTCAEPFGLIAKADGAVSHLPVTFSGRDNMKVDFQMGESHGSVKANGTDGVAKSEDGYISSEPGIDTIYDWNRRTGALTPIAARTPSFSSTNPAIGMFFFASGADYKLFETVERKFDVDTFAGGRRAYLMLDGATGEVTEVKIVNGDVEGENPLPLDKRGGGMPRGVKADALQAYELMDLHEAGRLRGRLAEIAATLKDDDNPVMMIVKFK